MNKKILFMAFAMLYAGVNADATINDDADKISSIVEKIEGHNSLKNKLNTERLRTEESINDIKIRRGVLKQRETDLGELSNERKEHVRKLIDTMLANQENFNKVNGAPFVAEIVMNNKKEVRDLVVTVINRVYAEEISKANDAIAKEVDESEKELSNLQKNLSDRAVELEGTNKSINDLGKKIKELTVKIKDDAENLELAMTIKENNANLKHINNFTKQEEIKKQKKIKKEKKAKELKELTVEIKDDAEDLELAMAIKENNANLKHINNLFY